LFYGGLAPASIDHRNFTGDDSIQHNESQQHQVFQIASISVAKA
jgi:hypothetical protein